MFIDIPGIAHIVIKHLPLLQVPVLHPIDCFQANQIGWRNDQGRFNPRFSQLIELVCLLKGLTQLAIERGGTQQHGRCIRRFIDGIAAPRSRIQHNYFMATAFHGVMPLNRIGIAIENEHITIPMHLRQACRGIRLRQPQTSANLAFCDSIRSTRPKPNTDNL